MHAWVRSYLLIDSALVGRGLTATAPAPRPSRRRQHSEPDCANLDRAYDPRHRIGRAAERMSKPDVIRGTAVRIVGRPEMPCGPGRARWVFRERIVRQRFGPARLRAGEPRLLPCLDKNRVGVVCTAP